MKKKTGGMLGKSGGVLGAVLALGLFILGQVLIFRQQLESGLGLSLLGVLLLVAVFLGWEKKLSSLLKLPVRGKKSPARAPLRQSEFSPKKKGPVSRKTKSADLNGVLLVSLAVILALGLAVQGQLTFIHALDGRDITKALFWYLAASLVFLLTLWKTRTVRPKEEELSFGTEKKIFFLIMALAAFLRIYKLTSIPSGMFIDQGMEGWAALRILHDHYRPIWEFDVFQNPALLLYQLAAWFLFFPPAPFTFYLFFACLSLATFPLVYWTFRQIGGARMALLALFILAVMRWNINFSRNGFPTIEVPFYTFGTLAFLLYGLRNPQKPLFYKNWPFYAAAVFFAMGLYTYQAYKVVPLLILLFAVYEAVTNRKAIVSNWKPILLFIGLFLVLAYPYLKHTYDLRGLGGRENDLSILGRVHTEHSYAPLIYNITRTALMFHWKGDPMARHNLQDYRMLDDATGILFFLGVMFSLAFAARKPSFYGLTGFLVMTVPCVLSIDPAHANRMLGTTPFIALLAAQPLAALWERVRSAGWQSLHRLFLAILGVVFAFMTLQNYNVYFNLQPHNFGSWKEYGVEETTIGKEIARYGEDYDYPVSAQYIGHYSLQFLSFFHRNRLRRFQLPDSLIAAPESGQRGLYFALEEGRPGVAGLLESVYPKGTEKHLTAPQGETYLFLYRVPPESVAAGQGLKGFLSSSKEEKSFPHFPKDLPAGPYHAELRGCVFLEQTGTYHFKVRLNGKASLTIGGHSLNQSKPLFLSKGFYALRLVMDVNSGAPTFSLSAVLPTGTVARVDESHLTTLPLNHGLEASYYGSSNESGNPSLVQWEPVVDYVNGNDIPVPLNPISAQWKGTLQIARAGVYRFKLETGDLSRVLIDGKEVQSSTKGPKEVNLRPGSHQLEAHFQRPLWRGEERASLMWAPPGHAGWEVIPFEAFGETRKRKKTKIPTKTPSKSKVK